ncbi:hypothetical protein B0H13DRAFT_1639245, partial [Mycena leptocephala]
CRFGCDAVETPHHLFVDCPRFNDWRTVASESRDVIRRTSLKLDEQDSLFRDDGAVWPLGSSLFYLGQLPSFDILVPEDQLSDPILRRKLLSHLASDWHSACIRLAGRIFGYFQWEMAARRSGHLGDPNLPK